MDFDLQWLLIALPVVFALGWVASRFDLRQVRRDGREAPKAYFKGLNLLLNEQHDKAIDAFIEAVQHDPDTTELHFGLGNLFRRRGDFERAVRVHQHLLERADLKAGGPPSRAARAGRRLHEGRPVRPRRGGLQGAGRHGLRRRGTPGAAVAARTRARLAGRHRSGQRAGTPRQRVLRHAHRALRLRTGAAGRCRRAAIAGRTGAAARTRRSRRGHCGRCC